VVAICTVGIGLLLHWIPAQGAGVVYLAGVLLVSSRYGLVPGVAASVTSMLAFNFFFLPPRHTLEIRDSGDWLTLAVFLGTALVTSRLASRAREEAALAEERAREAEVGLALTRALLRADDTPSALPALTAEVARALGVSSGEVRLGGGAGASETALPLTVGVETVGSLVLSGAPDGADEEAVTRIAGQLAALLALGLQRDALLDQRVEAGALRRSDEVKTALLRAVSHDLRTPLQAITTAAGTLRLLAVDDDERELAGTVVDAAERMSALVTDLLDLSRLQAGAFRPRADWCDVGDLVRTAVRQAGPAIAPRAVLEIPRDLPLVRGDAAQLERVLVNLIQNAAKFSPAPEPIEVHVAARTAGVDVEVLDRGPGVPAAERDSIFEPFYRGTGRVGVSGSGLGLAIARGLAEANGAHVEVDDRPGGGAAFRVAIPLPEGAS
jgi:two-component system sensor histidine kinase KdpD